MAGPRSNLVYLEFRQITALSNLLLFVPLVLYTLSDYFDILLQIMRTSWNISPQISYN